MAFFRSEPNVPDGEKARIEFHLQQIADAIGAQRLQLPFVSLAKLNGLCESDKSLSQIAEFAGDHLSYDIGGLAIEVVPEQLEKCGGGG